MNFLKYITIPLFVLSATLSCTKDPCKNTTCGSNGVCEQGICVCDSGYAVDPTTGLCLIYCGPNAYASTSLSYCYCDSGYIKDPATGFCTLYCEPTETNIQGSCVCNSTFTDLRDGEEYCLVTIGTQIWFAENLRYNASTSLYNPDNPSLVYGRLYDWNTAQTACPSGWHLPTDSEWNTLELELVPGIDSSEMNVIGDRGTHVYFMQSLTGWANAYDNGNNYSGFNVFPAGVYFDSSYWDFTFRSVFWSATEYDSTDAWMRRVPGNRGVERYPYDKSIKASCRCVKD